MKAMHGANCMMVDVGYESGNNRILKNVRKDTTVDDIKAFPREAKRAGLSIHGNWIIGLPGETKETIAQTAKLIKETKADAITVAVVSPFPGTAMYDWAKENGYLTTEDPNEYLDEHGHQKSIISYPELSSREIRAAVDSILKNYYLSFSYVPIAFRRVFNKHGWNELKVLSRSAVAFLKYLMGK
jgi:anaerobic magnesium-protoporphyrin IX monomethyl ester cyclase